MAAKNSKYECPRCGWVYDPAEGYPEGGIAPGIPFKDIPNDWKCPAISIIDTERKKVTIKLSIVYKTIVFFKDKFLIFSIDTPSPILSQCILSAYIPPVSFSLSGSVP